MVITSRRGASSFGCLMSLLIFVAALYYAVNIGEVFFRYYRLLDEMQTEAHLAAGLDDGTIRRRIRSDLISRDRSTLATARRSSSATRSRGRIPKRISARWFARFRCFGQRSRWCGRPRRMPPCSADRHWTR